MRTSLKNSIKLNKLSITSPLDYIKEYSKPQSIKKGIPSHIYFYHINNEEISMFLCVLRSDGTCYDPYTSSGYVKLTEALKKELELPELNFKKFPDSEIINKSVYVFRNNLFYSNDFLKDLSKLKTNA